jgi:hypothetical protein
MAINGEGFKFATVCDEHKKGKVSEQTKKIKMYGCWCMDPINLLGT